MNAVLLVLAIALVVSAAGLTEGRAAAEAQAKAFMRAHAGSPDDEDLQQIQFHAPKAYAIVKALLVKQQLGLLDPHRPNPSMRASKNLGPSKEDEATLQRMETEQSSRAPPAPMIEMEGARAPLPLPSHKASLFEGGSDMGVRSFDWRPPQDDDGLDLDSVLQQAQTAQKQDSLLAAGGSLDQKPVAAAVTRSAPGRDTPSGRFWSGFGEGMLAMTTRAVSAKPAPPVAMAQGAEVRPSRGAPPAQKQDRRAQTPAVAVDRSNPLQSFDWAAPEESDERPHVASLAAQNAYLSSVGLDDPPAPSRSAYLASRGPGPAAERHHRDALVQAVQAPQQSAPRADTRTNPLGSWFAEPRENPEVGFLRASA